MVKKKSVCQCGKHEFDPLMEEMVTHSNILSGEIPWTEKAGRLKSRGSQRVGHD